MGESYDDHLGLMATDCPELPVKDGYKYGTFAFSSPITEVMLSVIWDHPYFVEYVGMCLIIFFFQK